MFEYRYHASSMYTVETARSQRSLWACTLSVHDLHFVNISPWYFHTFTDDVSTGNQD